jgi:hypothetical protein
MILDRVRADSHLFGDLFQSMALLQMSENLGLSFG